MEKGKIIVVEGTDCSGKETQTKKLNERLNNEGIKTVRNGFPNYESPTGKIVGLSYLGKPYLAREMVEETREQVYERLTPYARSSHDKMLVEIVLEEIGNALAHGWFNEGAPNVDAKVSALYYAADRLYNFPSIQETIEEGTNVILDRYTYSNLAHQGGKIADREERKQMYRWLASLEFSLLGLSPADIRLFLHMPTDYAQILKSGRAEEADENERDLNHLYQAEKAFIEIAKEYDFDVINCVLENNLSTPKREDIKTPDDIHKEVYNSVIRKLIKK